MYYILLLLSYIGIKPTYLRQRVRGFYHKQDIIHFNLSVNHKKRSRRATSTADAAYHDGLSRAHTIEARKFRERASKML